MFSHDYTAKDVIDFERESKLLGIASIVAIALFVFTVTCVDLEPVVEMLVKLHS